MSKLIIDLGKKCPKLAIHDIFRNCVQKESFYCIKYREK